MNRSYGGGGPNGGAGIKFQNEGGTAVHDVVITHCYLKNNGWPGSTNGNLANIIFFTDYVSDPAQVNIEEALIRNEISYNLIEGSSIGFKDKNSQMLVRNHVGDDMEAKEWGDKIHHNIFINNPNRGIAVRQDFAQVYNNIVDSSSVGIVVGDPPSTGDREPFYVVVYNNLVINSSSGGGITSYHGLEERVSTYQEEPWHPFWYVWNNIVKDGHAENGRNDINILFDWSEHNVDMDTVHIDHNYFYPRSRDEKVINVVDNVNDYSADEYEANGWATNLYANLTDSEDPLHTTDSNYKTRHNHILEGATTIANDGIGGSHSYLEGITLPSYVGPCSDDECSWVDEVLALRNLGDIAVTDLRVTHAVVGSGTLSGTLTATLRWTAPVDAVTYTLRYSDTLIAEDNWTSAITVTVPFTASTPGSTEWLTAPVSYTGGTAYFALRSQNAAGAWSGLSNNAFWPWWEVYLPLVLR